MQYVEEISHYLYKTQGTVVGGKIKNASNCGYVQNEKLRCVFFRVLSSIDKSKYQQVCQPLKTTVA